MSDSQPEYAPRAIFHGDRRIKFLGTFFDLIPLDEILVQLRLRTDKDFFSYVVTPNVDHIIRLDRQAELQPIYRSAWMSWCDSHPIRRLARMLDIPMPHLNGTNVTECVFASVLQPGDSLLAIVASQRVMEAVKHKFSSFHWVGVCPSIGFENNPSEMNSLTQFVVDHPSRFIFICVGSPRSEILAAKIAERGEAKGTAFCIGAALEFMGGIRPRAPAYMRRLELEWLYRLLTDPLRLWRRYVLSFVPLLRLFLRELLGRTRNRLF